MTTNQNEQEIWTRNCPKCGKKLFYASKHGRNQSNSNINCCKSCAMKSCGISSEYKRKCSKCNKELFYKTIKNLNRATVKKSCCKNCRSIKYKYPKNLERKCSFCGKK